MNVPYLNKKELVFSGTYILSAYNDSIHIHLQTKFILSSVLGANSNEHMYKTHHT